MSYALGWTSMGPDDTEFTWPTTPPSNTTPRGADYTNDYNYPASGPAASPGGPASPAPTYQEPSVDDPIPGEGPSPGGGGGWTPRVSSGSPIAGGTQQATMGTASWLLLGAVVAAGIFAWRGR